MSKVYCTCTGLRNPLEAALDRMYPGIFKEYLRKDENKMRKINPEEAIIKFKDRTKLFIGGIEYPIDHMESSSFYCPGEEPRIEIKIETRKPSAKKISRGNKSNKSLIVPYTGKFLPTIDKVIFNDPATIVIWSDGTKTIVKCMEDDIYDPEVGLAMCMAEKFFGSHNALKRVVKEHYTPPEELP